MPRFVVLRHETPAGYERPSHFDFMLEQRSTLRTWALLQAPDEIAEQPAEALADHRLAYLDYEGPVSGDRGHVSRLDAGTYELMADDERLIELRLRGARLNGVVRLALDGTTSTWRFAFVAD